MIAALSYFIVLRHNPDHVVSHGYVCSSHIGAGRLHYCPRGTWIAGNINSQHIHSETPRHPPISEPICTFRAVSAYALPDNELPLPEHSPDQVCWATADLDHLSR